MSEALEGSSSHEELKRRELKNAPAVPNMDNIITACACRGLRLRERRRNSCSFKSVDSCCSSTCREFQSLHEQQNSSRNRQRPDDKVQNYGLGKVKASEMNEMMEGDKVMTDEEVEPGEEVKRDGKGEGKQEDSKEV